MTDLRLTVGERIRILRDRAGMTLRDLAERSGAHVSTIHGIESGKTQARVHTLQAIAAALGVSVGSLIPAPEK